MIHEQDERLRLLLEIQSKDSDDWEQIERDAPSLDEVFPKDYEDIPEPEPEPKWQPVMLIARRRVECACGALAIFVSLEQVEREEGKPADVLYSAWCQSCWAREVEADDEPLS